MAAMPRTYPREWKREAANTSSGRPRAEKFLAQEPAEDQPDLFKL